MVAGYGDVKEDAFEAIQNTYCVSAIKSSTRRCREGNTNLMCAASGFREHNR